MDLRSAVKINLCFLFFTILGNHTTAFAQEKAQPVSLRDTSYQLLYTISIETTYFALDNLQNLYAATATGQVLKFDRNGTKQFEYNNNRLGRIGKIEVQNPLTILVYYPELAVIVILDRTLSEIKQINLFDLDFISPTAIALANDNSIWIYDEVTTIIKKINQAEETLVTSRNLNQLVGKRLVINQMLEKNNRIYFNDTENGLFIFDNFGQLIDHLPIKGMSNFQLVNRQLFYWKAQQFFSLMLDNLEEKEIELPIPNEHIDQVGISQNLLYLATKGAIQVFGQ